MREGAPLDIQDRSGVEAGAGSLESGKFAALSAPTPEVRSKHSKRCEFEPMSRAPGSFRLAYSARSEKELDLALG